MTRQFPRLFLLLAAIILTAGCAKLTLAWADIKPSGPTARPDVLGVFADEDPVTSPEDWTAERAPLATRGSPDAKPCFGTRQPNPRRER